MPDFDAAEAIELCEQVDQRIVSADRIKGLSRHLRAAVGELQTIRDEVEEYVHDGGDFNWTEAVIKIRAWREEADRIAELEAEVERLKAFEKAIKDRHNGYDPEARAAMETLTEPATPEQALDELLEEAEALGKTEGQFEVARLKADAERYRYTTSDARQGVHQETPEQRPAVQQLHAARTGVRSDDDPR